MKEIALSQWLDIRDLCLSVTRYPIDKRWVASIERHSKFRGGGESGASGERSDSIKEAVDTMIERLEGSVIGLTGSNLLERFNVPKGIFNDLLKEEKA